jgi:hypothetical protein
MFLLHYSVYASIVASINCLVCIVSLVCVNHRGRYRPPVPECMFHLHWSVYVSIVCFLYVSIALFRLLCHLGERLQATGA